MAFQIKKFLDHGTSNPIVARLSLQILTVLKSCNVTPEFREAVGEIYFGSLQRKLIRCWEIQQRFIESFQAVVDSYEPSAGRERVFHIPQVDRLEEECHNFLYEGKNYIRDVLKVYNLLYGTDFEGASEFSRGKKDRLSLIDWASSNFGENDERTACLQDSVAFVEMIVRARNAVEHPGGYSGNLVIQNFTLAADAKLNEPIWYRENEAGVLCDPTSVRVDMDALVCNLLLLGEEAVIVWADGQFREQGPMRIASIPLERRDPKCPVKYQLSVSEEFARKIAERKET